jgi:hypothetical protein
MSLSRDRTPSLAEVGHIGWAPSGEVLEMCLSIDGREWWIEVPHEQVQAIIDGASQPRPQPVHGMRRSTFVRVY